MFSPHPQNSALASLSIGDSNETQSAPKKVKRTSIACRRCRRLRVKCIQEQNRLPCMPCRAAGSAEANSCAIPKRGDDRDRKYRIKVPSPEQETRAQNEGQAASYGPIRQSPLPVSPHTARKIEIYSASDIWSLLPPHEELIRGARVFVTTCLQVGFIPKSLFVERLSKDGDSVNVFLLISVLAISARFTPELCARFGSGRKASDFFVEIANVLLADEMFKTDLETAQAFFLLGMAEWGKGERNRSAIHMGIAVRIAGVLRLHREETYALPPNATPEDAVQAEVARRTFWSIKSHDNLYTQQHLPVSFANSDITTLLPCSENDFAFGRVPLQRAALAGTIPALKEPHLASLPSRSMFATLIQVHDLWGMIARTACRDDLSMDDADSRPWDITSRYSTIASILSKWEGNMPKEHTWSAWNLRGYQAEHVDLAYLSVISITRMNNIALRRIFLESIVAHVLDPQSSDNSAPPHFWDTMSYELFSNVFALYDAIETYFGLRGADDGFPTMLAFCAYTCGSIVSYLCRWPQLCPQLHTSAEKVFEGTLNKLSTFADKWPLACDWVNLLRRVAAQGQSAAKDQHVRPITEVCTRETLLNTIANATHSPESRRSSFASHIADTTDVAGQDGYALQLLSDAATSYDYTYDQQHATAAQEISPIPAQVNHMTDLNMPFDDYMQGYIHFNFADWRV